MMDKAPQDIRLISNVALLSISRQLTTADLYNQLGQGN
uniref:Uncharacterized protein n=1 Tax=Arundo donax TaxID=35708 RepID=A0A0A8YNF9_ARUDO